MFFTSRAEGRIFPPLRHVSSQPALLPARSFPEPLARVPGDHRRGSAGLVQFPPGARALLPTSPGRTHFRRIWGAGPETEVSSGPLTVTGLRGTADSGLKMNTRGLGSQLKDSIPVTELSASGPFESQDLLRKGFPCVKNELLPSHPLELSEKNFQLNQDKMNFSTLRNIQGLFAPLKLQMEFKAVQQAQRLPFLPSSNLSLDILRGNDETIGFEDILNDPSQSETMGEPHLMVEYKLGLL
ncbi:proteasome maturation protein [Dasypus novemcinctus]|uniref:proteasome maturation protein n=1 Tax=Dasypus novemcinctus TaxID=9361 RepID=UPI00062A7239